MSEKETLTLEEKASAEYFLASGLKEVANPIGLRAVIAVVQTECSNEGLIWQNRQLKKYVSGHVERIAFLENRVQELLEANNRGVDERRGLQNILDGLKRVLDGHYR